MLDHLFAQVIIIDASFDGLIVHVHLASSCGILVDSGVWGFGGGGCGVGIMLFSRVL